jgi:hypothetical protein
MKYTLAPVLCCTAQPQNGIMYTMLHQFLYLLRLLRWSMHARG